MAVNFEIEVRRIKVGKDGYFDVRGINAEDLTFLTTTYIDDLKAAVSKHGKRGGRVPPDKVAEVLLDLAKSFPSLSAEIISRAADAPDETDKFRRLPFPVTLAALKAITELSIQDGGVELKNLVAGLGAMLEANGVQLGPLPTHLKTTSEESAKTSLSS